MTTMALRQFSVSPVTAIAFGVAGFILLPLLYVTYLALTTDLAVWNRLLSTRIPELLANTLSLAAGSAFGTLFLGVSLAWLVTRFEFFDKRKTKVIKK